MKELTVFEKQLHFLLFPRQPCFREWDIAVFIFYHTFFVKTPLSFITAFFLSVRWFESCFNNNLFIYLLFFLTNRNLKIIITIINNIYFY